MKKMIRFIATILIAISIIGTIPVSAYTPDDEETFVNGTASDEAHYFMHYDYPMDDFYGKDTIKYITSETWQDEYSYKNFTQIPCTAFSYNLSQAHTLLMGNFNYQNQGSKADSNACSVLIDWYLGDPYVEIEPTNINGDSLTYFYYGNCILGRGHGYQKDYGIYGITKTLYFSKYLKNYKKAGYDTPYDMWKAETQVFRDYMDYQFAQVHKRITNFLNSTIDEDGYWYELDDDTGETITHPVEKGSNKKLQSLKNEFSKAFKYTKAEKKLKNIKISNKKLKKIMPSVYRTKLKNAWNNINELLDGIDFKLVMGFREAGPTNVDTYINLEATLEYLECFEWEYRHIIEIADKIAQRNLSFDTWQTVKKEAKNMKTAIFCSKDEVKLIAKNLIALNN